ncbi:MAG: hypothetical protein A49_00740 [Methyloceanibacter sp.]|nr:MAG: hypothetical protein A49_00740 [Methyloceanibacter sp.]
MLTRVTFALLVLVLGASLAFAEDAQPETTILSLGLTDRKVDKTDLMKRMILPVPRYDTGGIAYGWVAHAKKGDHVEVHLRKDGTSLVHNLRDVTEDDTDVLLMAGKTGVPAGGWPKGQYTAKVTVTRGGETIAEQETDPIPFE